MKLRRIGIVRPGEVVLLESTVPLNQEQVKIIGEALKKVGEKSDIKFVLIPLPLRVARVEENENGNK